MDPQLKLALTVVAGLLADWEEQFGEGVCDCRHEPYNEGYVCNACTARTLLLDMKEARCPACGSDKPHDQSCGCFDNHCQ